MEKDRKLSTGQWVFLAVALVVLASVGLTVYNNNLFNQRQNEAIRAEKDRAEAERKEQDSQKWVNELNRTGCLDSAQKTFRDGWDADVKYLGRTDGRLPDPYASTHEQRLKDAKDDCYRQYGE